MLSNMRMNSLIVVPAVFAVGIVSIVLLQVVGLVSIGSHDAPASTSQSGTSLTESGANASASVGRSVGELESSADAQKTIAALTTQINELRKQAQEATLQRDVMRGEIEALNESLEIATTNNEFLPSGQGAAGDESLDNSNGLDADRLNRVGGRRGFGQPDGDEQYASLIDAGIDPSVAAQIKQRTDQWALQRLELIDQASREGWRESEQFSERIAELREERPDVREELGDDDYDQYLYAAGDANRVQVDSIIDGSAAQLAGIQTGDLIRSYANELVYTSRGLQGATREGTRDEIVQVTVERNGQQLNVEMPRGPMGVTLVGLRIEPDGF